MPCRICLHQRSCREQDNQDQEHQKLQVSFASWRETRSFDHNCYYQPSRTYQLIRPVVLQRSRKPTAWNSMERLRRAQQIATNLRILLHNCKFALHKHHLINHLNFRNTRTALSSTQSCRDATHKWQLSAKLSTTTGPPPKLYQFLALSDKHVKCQ